MSVELMVLLIIAGGVALIYLARVSRRVHEQLRSAGIREFDASRIMNARNPIEWFKLQFLGPQPRFLEIIGPILAAAVIASVAIVLVGVVGAILIARGWH